MTIPAWFAKIDGVLDGINARLSAFGDSASTIAALTAERDALKAQASKAETDLAAAMAAKVSAESAASTALADKTAAETKATELATKEQDIEARASARALEIVANQGSPLPAKSTPGTGTGKAQHVGPDGKPLRGRELALAAHRARTTTNS